MLNRRVTRTILGTTETTSKTVSPNADTVAFALVTTSEFYVGFHGPFASRYFQMGSTVNAVASVLTVSYWDGSAWTAVDDLLDQTSVAGATFAQSGFISWEPPTGWSKRALTGVDSDIELYWVKLTVSANFTAGTVLQSVLNLFCDDATVRAYYPELITDTGYLPSSRTNFLEQYEAAKNLVVLRLKQRRLIDDESQILDPNEVAVAAVHAFAWIILNPIARTDEQRSVADEALKNFNKEIGSTALSVDQDKSGTISDAERAATISTPRIWRR